MLQGFRIGAWDTSSVSTMTQMFQGATAFNQPIGAWVTSSVTTMGDMFGGATSFNSDISGWDTSSVSTMTQCFKVLLLLTNLLEIGLLLV